MSVATRTTCLVYGLFSVGGAGLAIASVLLLGWSLGGALAVVAALIAGSLGGWVLANLERPEESDPTSPPNWSKAAARSDDMSLITSFLGVASQELTESMDHS